MPDQSGAEARLAAARACQDVFDGGQSLATVMSSRLAGLTGSQDRALARRITLSVMRRRPELDWYLARLLKRPLPRKERVTHYLLLAGLAQLVALELAPHAVLNATVEATRLARRERLTGLVNGVLQTFLRQREALAVELPDEDTLRYGLPAWILARMQADWPHHWRSMAEAANESPPVWLRVNRRKVSREDYQRQLEEAGIESRISQEAPDALALAHPVAIRRLPGFADGLVSVQDAGAQLAAEWTGVADGMRVLDACAAPGGKACHLLERADIHLTAVESDESRARVIHDNLGRLGLEARVRAADATAVESWWDGEAFDRILVDAPCSSTGVLRRHPEIRWLRREADLAGYEQVQARLLDRLWPLLKPGGMLVYITCSVFHSENAAQALRFMEEHDDADIAEPARALGQPANPGRQYLPGEGGMDGFYMVRFRRTGG